MRKEFSIKPSDSEAKETEDPRSIPAGLRHLQCPLFFEAPMIKIFSGCSGNDPLF